MRTLIQAFRTKELRNKILFVLGMIIGEGETTVAFTLKGVKASASAKTKIEAAGGSISED